MRNVHSVWAYIMLGMARIPFGIMKYVKRCECHTSQASAAGCDRRGQRLRTAYEWAMGKLRLGLEESTRWTPEYFLGCRRTSAEVQGTARAAFAVARRKLQYLDRIPWLFVRLAEPGVRARVIEQYDSTDIGHHHRLSVFLCKHGSENRRRVMEICDDGTNVHPSIQFHIDRLDGITMDDTRNETPHAEAKRKFEPSRPLCCD